MKEKIVEENTGIIGILIIIETEIGQEKDNLKELWQQKGQKFQ